MALNSLTDDVPYAEVSDVEKYVRNKTFDTTSDPTESEVAAMIDEASEEVDSRTGRAWRTRTVSDRELRVNFSHKQERQSTSRRRYPAATGSRGQTFTTAVSPRGVVNLPNPQVRSIDSAQGDSIVVLNRDSTTDITANEGRDVDEGWVLDERHGILYVDIENYLRGPLWGTGLSDRPLVRVTYRYGTDEAGNDVSQSVPADIKRATAQLVAADLIETDQYGKVIASGPEGAPDQNQAAQRLRESANSTIDRYRYRVRL